MTKSRRELILQIVSEEDIRTQGQLLEALARRGATTTQATLSRDMRSLHLIKDKGRYVRLARALSKENHNRLQNILRESLVSAAQAQNLVVIKTLPGLANGACTAIDSMQIYGLVGSIAGDDTLFLAMTDNEAAEDFVRQLDER